MSKVNKKQVGGEHYKGVDQEHWDWVHANNLDYFQGQITKYVYRWKSKNGLEDLQKAHHFLEKYMELESEKVVADTQISLFPTTVGEIADSNIKQGKENIINNYPELAKSTGMKHPFGYNKEEDDGVE
tara:strand:+ start:201 stop:584 length:384 start_codon:yes stop_codon:yes gene_type:complete